MLGSGIFVLPGMAASITGPSIWMAYLVAAICVLPAALSKAELSTAMPTSGGTYVYVERAFGPLAGTIAGVGLWLSLILKSAFSLVGLSAYLVVLVHLPQEVSALVILCGVVLLNITGVKKVGQTQLIIMSLVFTSLLAVVFPGFIKAHSASFWPFFTDGSLGFFTAVAFVFVSYTGVTEISAVAEEVKNPDKTLPRAILISLLVVSLLYALVSFALVGVLDFDELKTDMHPIYSLAKEVGGDVMGSIIAVIGVITLSSMANTGVLASSRFPFAMSRDKLFPSYFGYLHSSFLTPIWCILLTGVVVATCILFFDVFHIAKLASAFKVLMFIFDNACTIVFRETGVQWYNPRYKSFLYPWTQVFGIVSGIFLLAMLGVDGIGAIGAMCGLGALFYFAYGKKYVKRQSILRLYGRRALMMLLGGRYSLTRKGLESQDSLEGKDSSPVVFRTSSGVPLKFESLKKDASVIVPLFGAESSAEMLSEIATSIADGARTSVIHVKEFPYQTSLDAVLEEDLLMQSLTRRISAMAKNRDVDVDFDAVVTHDLVSTVQEISESPSCKWLVVGWRGRVSSGLFIRNTLGWVLSHLHCNLALFKDSGVRYIREILVCVKPEDNDLELVLKIGDRLSSIYDANLTFMQVVSSDMSEAEKENRFKVFNKNIEEIKNRGVKVNLIEVQADIQKVIDASSAYDLLVFGTGATHEKYFWDVLFNKGRDRLMKEAPCSVLRIGTSKIKKFQIKNPLRKVLPVR